MMSQQLQQSQQSNGAVAPTSAAGSLHPSPAQIPAAEPARFTDDNPDFPELQNRAGESNSPYVRQHATSLVKWQFPDGQTRQRAAKENKPIFLHIGFLADHLCRLTAQDSFSNPAVAAFLNAAFIPVIVDREERPDLDTIYQNYSEAVNATGGWPLNMFLTPSDLYPIFGGTYWPGPGTEHSLAIASLGNANGGDEAYTDFLAIAKKIHTYWVEQEDRCRIEASEMLHKLQDFAQEGTFSGTAGSSQPVTPTRAMPDLPGADLDLDQVDEALERISEMFDPVDFGFGTPKFPNPARLSFLLRVEHYPEEVQDIVGEKEAKLATSMALGTLRRIRDGGLRDHLGAGFMRYSVTRNWSVPHFEKMVGENALLLGVFLDAWLGQSAELMVGDEFADVVFELGDYLTSPLVSGSDGGFVSSEAADSYYRKGDRHMREGAFYTWTRREFDHVVGDGETDGQHASLVAAEYWNVLEDGNVPQDLDPHDEFINQNVLHVVKDVQELSRQFGIPVSEVQRILISAREKLRDHREKERAHPPQDEKIVVNVNGMVISALSRTAAAVGPVDAERAEKYLGAAKQAAAFVKDKLWDAEQKTLHRFYYDGPSKTRAFADDYAFLIEGLLDLYDTTLDGEWLQWAKELQATQTRLFYDSPSASLRPFPQRAGSGGFYSNEIATEAPGILRLKSGMDKSQPSTNSVAASNLFRLGTILGDEKLIKQAKETINAFEAEILQYPWLFVGLLTGVVTARLGVKTVHATAEEQDTLRRYYQSPRSVVGAVVVGTRSVGTESVATVPIDLVVAEHKHETAVDGINESGDVTSTGVHDGIIDPKVHHEKQTVDEQGVVLQSDSRARNEVVSEDADTTPQFDAEVNPVGANHGGQGHRILAGDGADGAGETAEVETGLVGLKLAEEAKGEEKTPLGATASP